MHTKLFVWVESGVRMRKLTSNKIQYTDKTKVSYGDGLYLNSRNGKKNWTLIYTFNHKRREIGLGPFPMISKKEACNQRNLYKIDIYRGIDPKEEKDKKRQKYNIEDTFQKISDEYIKKFSLEWKNKKHKQQWENTLKTYVYPFIGKFKVGEIKTKDIEKVLSPIWIDKEETARRVRQRVEKVLSYAKAKGFYSGDNPALLKGNLEFLLKKQKYISKNQPAMPFKNVPNFMKELCKYSSNVSLALQFLILTATRSGEVRFAEWEDINFKKKVWVIPEIKTKTSRIHRIPLSKHSIEILNKMYLRRNGTYIFYGTKGNQPLSENSMLYFLKREFSKISFVPHGFRSSFRDWAENQNKYTNRIMEYCLGHVIKNKTEAAYQRDDLLDLRKIVMFEWSQYIFKKTY